MSLIKRKCTREQCIRIKMHPRYESKTFCHNYMMGMCYWSKDALVCNGVGNIKIFDTGRHRGNTEVAE